MVQSGVKKLKISFICLWMIKLKLCLVLQSIIVFEFFKICFSSYISNYWDG